MFDCTSGGLTGSFLCRLRSYIKVAIVRPGAMQVRAPGAELRRPHYDVPPFSPLGGCGGHPCSLSVATSRELIIVWPPRTASLAQVASVCNFKQLEGTRNVDSRSGVCVLAIRRACKTEGRHTRTWTASSIGRAHHTPPVSDARAHMRCAVARLNAAPPPPLDADNTCSTLARMSLNLLGTDEAMAAIKQAVKAPELSALRRKANVYKVRVRLDRLATTACVCV